MTYQPRFPYAWSSPLVAAATSSFTAQYLADDLRRRFFDEMQFLPYVAWHPLRESEGQRAFFSPSHYSAAAALADELLAQENPELSGFAHQNVQYVMNFLAQSGFPDIQLDPIGPNDFAVATVLRMLRHFQVAGEEGYLLSEDMPHEAFRLPAGTFKVYRMPNQKPCIAIDFPNGDSLYVAVDTWTELEGPALSHWVNALMGTSGSFSQVPATGLVLPNVSFDLDIDVSWLLGAEAWNQYQEIWRVAQAIKKVRFNMGAAGFLFEAAFAMSMEKCISQPKLPKVGDIVIKDDFTAWMTTNKSPFPIWVAKIPVSAFSAAAIEIPSSLPTHEVM